MSETKCSILFGIFLILVIMFMFWKGTSAEYWYAGMHDSQCEGNGCHCYERFTK